MVLILIRFNSTVLILIRFTFMVLIYSFNFFLCFKPRRAVRPDPDLLRPHGAGAVYSNPRHRGAAAAPAP